MIEFESYKGRKIVPSSTPPANTNNLWFREGDVPKLFAYESTFWEALETVERGGNRANNNQTNEYIGYHRIAAFSTDKHWLWPHPILIKDFWINAISAGSTHNYVRMLVDNTTRATLHWAPPDEYNHLFVNFLVTSEWTPVALQKMFVQISPADTWQAHISLREAVIP